MAEEKKGKYTVLVVDDEEDILTSVSIALGELGVQILKARGGHEALGVIRDKDPDIIVLDEMMPKGGGFDILPKIKGRPTMKGKRPLICMMTANTAKKFRDYALLQGCDDFLYKPFPMETLTDIVGEFIEQLDEGVEDAR
jgi:DNA-binding response OmpR family regulator